MDEEKSLYEEQNMNEVNNSNVSFMGWIQSFTKKIVSIFSVLYIIIVIIMVSMLAYNIHNGLSDGFDTIVTEINETFRVVIGGYLIKAGVENGFKITGEFLSRINKQKLKMLFEEEQSECTDNNYNEEDVDNI